MVVKVATTCLQWSHSVLPYSPSSSQTLASAISSPSFRRRSRGSNGGGRGAPAWPFVHRLDRSSRFGGAQSTRLYRSRSCHYPLCIGRTIRWVCSASLESFSNEEFAKKIEDLALGFQLSADNSDNEINAMGSDNGNCNSFSDQFSSVNITEPPWLEMRQDPPDWSGGGEIFPVNIEQKANSVDLPFSLRIIKKKLRWKEGFREAGDSAYCSVKKAFSSMVFIVRELHSHTLQMREILYCEDLQGILARVQKEMHASFVWLFQRVFSHTPILMVHVMILLANFTVYSMGNNTAIAAGAPQPSATAEIASASEIQNQKNHKFDSSAIKKFSVSSSTGKTSSVGGNNGGDGKCRPVASDADGDGLFDRSDGIHSAVLPDGGASRVSSMGTTGETESVTSVKDTRREEEEASLWNSMIGDASNMQMGSRGEALNYGTMQRFVSPVTARMESDDYAEYLRTEFLYQTRLSLEPNNPLLLANYAQFLYLVAHDYDRAEEYFKRAVEVEPRDAEACNKYANFLWNVRNDAWGAEESYLEAISAQPTSSYYAATYAHFLWNTGGRDTYFPLGSQDTTQEL